MSVSGNDDVTDSLFLFFCFSFEVSFRGARFVKRAQFVCAGSERG